MISGIGVGLRSKHFSAFLEQQPDISWLEILADNYLQSHGILLEKLQSIRQHYPMVMHGVGLSLVSTDALDMHYLNELKHLSHTLNTAWISDHLCWTHHQGIYSHELLPIPFTHECLQHTVARIKKVQDHLQQQILIENTSSYLQFSTDEMFEAEFLAEVAEQADCFILLDVNNVYVNSQNHGFDPLHYFNCLDGQRIKQIHLGGYTEQAATLVDTHGEAIHAPVWPLYETALNQYGALPTNIEWDNNVPEWPVLLQQSNLAKSIWEHCHALS